MSALRINVGGPVRLIDLGPWQPDALAVQDDEVGVVRFVDPASLPRTLDPFPPRPITGILSRTEARRRHLRTGISDEAVIDALRQAGGVVRVAGAIAGLSPQGLRSRLTTLEGLGLIPADVQILVDARRRDA